MSMQYEDPDNADKWSNLAALRYNEASCLLDADYYNGAEYFYGHSTEAALKALCFDVHGSYPRNHDLRAIATQASFPPDSMAEDLEYLDQRRVSSRYGMSCTKQFAQKAERCARLVCEYVNRQINARAMRRDLRG